MKVNRSIATCGLNYLYVAWSNGGRVPIGDFISSSNSKKKRRYFFFNAHRRLRARPSKKLCTARPTIGCCLKILIDGGSGDFFHTRSSGIEMWTNFQLTECWCFRYCCLAFWKKTILWSHATSTWRSEIWGGTTWQNVNRSPHLQKWRRHCHATSALLWSATSPNRIKPTDCDREGPTLSRSAPLESP